MNDAQFRQAQIAYDNQEPPDDDEGCPHDWRMIPGEAKDGTRFAKCRKCGVEVEV